MGIFKRKQKTVTTPAEQPATGQLTTLPAAPVEEAMQYQMSHRPSYKSDSVGFGYPPRQSQYEDYQTPRSDKMSYYDGERSARTYNNSPKASRGRQHTDYRNESPERAYVPQRRSSSAEGILDVHFSQNKLTMDQADGTRLVLRSAGKVSVISKNGRRLNVSTKGKSHRRTSWDTQSEDNDCYNRSNSFCRHCQRTNCCDCCSTQNPVCHNTFNGSRCQQQKGETEVYHTTYPCYDPNCKGGSSCNQWKNSYPENAGNQREGDTMYGNNMYPYPQVTTKTVTTVYDPSNAYNSGNTRVAQMLFNCDPNNAFIQGNMISAAYQHPNMISGQPYLVNTNRPMPMTLAGVPVVIPTAAAGGANSPVYMGAVQPRAGGGTQLRRLGC